MRGVKNRTENSLLLMNDDVFMTQMTVPNTLSNKKGSSVKSSVKGSCQSVCACVNEQIVQPSWHNK